MKFAASAIALVAALMIVAFQPVEARTKISAWQGQFVDNVVRARPGSPGGRSAAKPASGLARCRDRPRCATSVPSRPPIVRRAVEGARPGPGGGWHRVACEAASRARPGDRRGCID